MDAESSICLSDLIPALRWSRPQHVAEALTDPRLPTAWWSSVSLPRALGTLGLEWLCDRLARLSTSRWEHLALNELLPALQVHTVDPALPGWPEPARAVVVGLGGWPRLRRLTAGDLVSPAVPATPEVVLTAVFREVLGQIPAQPPIPQAPAAQPAAASTQTSIPHTSSQPHVAVPPNPVPQPRSEPSRLQPPPASSPGTESPQHIRPVTHTGPQPVVSPHTGPQPVVQPAAQSDARRSEADRQTPAQQTPAQPAAAQAGTGADQSGSGQAGAAQRETAPAADYPLVRLVDGIFRDWSPLERAVAAERLFAADPVSLRALAHRIGVDREVLSYAQRAAEERVLQWLRSADSTAVTGHMFRLSEWLGAAATEEQLIGADPAHPVEIPTLGAPLWRVLVTLMPDRRLQDGWLVAGDLGGLRERTRQLLASTSDDTDVTERLGQLGIRSHSARAWLDSLPAEQTSERRETPSEPFPAQPLPRRTPGTNGHHHRGGQPIPQVGSSGIDPSAALAALSALSSNRPNVMPGHRAGVPSTPPPPPPGPNSDPRRWQRIEVTSEHLRGEPVAVPENYAAQLGMRPGTLLSVTGPGDNAVVLVWRDRQPVFDSLQPVLMRLKARPGDQVYVTVDGYRLDAQLTS